MAFWKRIRWLGLERNAFERNRSMYLLLHAQAQLVLGMKLKSNTTIKLKSSSRSGI